MTRNISQLIINYKYGIVDADGFTWRIIIFVGRNWHAIKYR